jgi:hypothetical protein
MRLCFSLRPLKCGVVSIGYALKSTSFNEQASHVFHGPRLASWRRFLSSAFKACLWFLGWVLKLRLRKTCEHILRGNWRRE